MMTRKKLTKIVIAALLGIATPTLGMEQKEVTNQEKEVKVGSSKYHDDQYMELAPPLATLQITHTMQDPKTGEPFAYIRGPDKDGCGRVFVNYHVKLNPTSDWERHDSASPPYAYQKHNVTVHLPDGNQLSQQNVRHTHCVYYTVQTWLRPDGSTYTPQN